MPAAAVTPWGRRIDVILADGAWHLLDDLVADAGQLIPPGVAHRARERNRATHSTIEHRPLTTESVATGRRHMIRGLLDARVVRGRIERGQDTDHGHTVYRRRPE